MSITPIGLNHRFFYQNELPNTLEEGWYTLTKEEKPVSIRDELNAPDQPEPRSEPRSLEKKSQKVELNLPCFDPAAIVYAFCADFDLKTIKIFNKVKKDESEAEMRNRIIASLKQNKIVAENTTMAWRNLEVLKKVLKQKLTIGPIICSVQIPQKQDFVIISAISEKSDRILLKNSSREGFDCTIAKISDYLFSRQFFGVKSTTVVQIKLRDCPQTISF